MSKKVKYPIISVFIDDVHNVSEEQGLGNEDVTVDASLSISAYERISGRTQEKCLDFAHELIKYFTPHLLLHHYQDEVPVITVFLSVSEEQVDINTHGGYYTNFIKNLPVLQNIIDEILLLTREDLNIQRHNIEEIIMNLEDIPRIDIKGSSSDEDNTDDFYNEDLNWSYTRVVRTPYSEVFALYLNDNSAGEIHIHIGKNIDTTIITTIDITEGEKAQLMGYIHEKLLEALEEENNTNSAITFYSEAEEYI